MPAPKLLPWAIAVLSLAYAATVHLSHSECPCADAAQHEHVSTIRDTPQP